MPYINTQDQKKLYVRTIGRGQPVLLLSGLGMHSAHWLPFIAPFLQRYRFYMPDYRGFGRSSGLALNNPNIFVSHAQDVQDTIAHFKLNQFLLIGYSLGASTALHLQQSQQFSQVKRYLHIDQTPCIANQTDWPYGLLGEQQPFLFQQLSQLQQLLEQHPQAQHIGQLPTPQRRQVAAILADTFAKTTGQNMVRPLLQGAAFVPALFRRVLPLAQLADLRAYLHSYTQGAEDYRPVLQNCPVPVTFMIGMQSPLYDARGQLDIAAQTPNASVVRFEKSGHVPLTDQPVQFVRALGRFLAG